MTSISEHTEKQITSSECETIKQTTPKTNIRKRFFQAATWTALSAVAYLAFLVCKLYPKLKKEKPEGYPMVEPWDFWIVFASALGCLVLKWLVREIGTPLFAHLCKQESDIHVKEERLQKMGRYLYSTIYYSFFSLWGYMLLKDLEIYPSELGGQGHCKTYAQDERGANSNILYLNKPEGITFFSLVTMGYTVEGLIQHLLISPKSARTADFFEMNLHHIATITLFSCMILTNQERVGATIAYVHLLADVPGALIKALGHTDLKLAKVGFFALTLFSWGYTRNFIIPRMAYCCYQEFIMPTGMEAFQQVFTIQSNLLIVLCFLHYFWMAMLIRILYDLVCKGDAEDHVTPINSKKAA